MTPRDWLNLLVGFCVVIGCAFGVAHDRKLLMSPQPGTASLKSLVADIAEQVSGSRPAVIDVVEKAFYVSVSSRVTDVEKTSRLKPITDDLERRGFRVYRLKEERSALLCKGEAVVKISIDGPQLSDRYTVSVDATWGSASATCR